MDTEINDMYLNKVKEKYLEVLKDVFNYNSETTFLSENNSTQIFDDIKNKNDHDLIKSFHALPLTTYKDYKPYIDRIYNEGKKNVLSKEYPVWFAKSGGTTGPPKTFPIYLPPGKANPLKLFPNQDLIDNVNKYGGCDLNLQSKGLTLIWKTPKYYSPHNKIPVGFIASVIRIPENDIEPKEVKYIVNHNDHLKISILYNLLEKNMEYIYTPFINIVVDFFSVLENHFEILNCCLKEKRFFKENELESDINPNILTPIIEDYKKLLKEKSRRIEEILMIFDQYRNNNFQDIGIQLWPNLKLIVSNYSSVTLEQYLKLAKYYISNKPYYANSGYVCSESYIGLPIYFQPKSYKIVDYINPEFIPYDLNNDQYVDNADTKFVWEVDINKTYEIVITCYNGYYRYKLGDIVKIVGWIDHSPVVEFVKRIGWSLALGSYRIEDEYVIKSMTNLSLPIKYYVAYNNVSAQPSGFGFFVELDSKCYISNKSNIVKIKKSDIKIAENQINDYFSKVHEFYKEAIQQRKLHKAVIRIVPKNFFHKYKEKKSNTSNSSSMVQTKIPISITDSESVDYFIKASKEITILE